MNAPREPISASPATPLTASGMMTGADYRASLRRRKPVVYLDGRRVESVADEAMLAPGINAVAVSYDRAHEPALAALMLARQTSNGRTVNRLTMTRNLAPVSTA